MGRRRSGKTNMIRKLNRIRNQENVENCTFRGDIYKSMQQYDGIMGPVGRFLS